MPEPPVLGTVTPDEFRRIRAIFEAALERPAEARRAFVAEACAGNLALQAEVERMLATEGDRHQLLDRASTRADDRRGGGTAPAAPGLCPLCGASELGQPVALKFVSAIRADERARAHACARRYASPCRSRIPNVCRICDIGHHFPCRIRVNLRREWRWPLARGSARMKSPP